MRDGQEPLASLQRRWFDCAVQAEGEQAGLPGSVCMLCRQAALWMTRAAKLKQRALLPAPPARTYARQHSPPAWVARAPKSPLAQGPPLLQPQHQVPQGAANGLRHASHQADREAVRSFSFSTSLYPLVQVMRMGSSTARPIRMAHMAGAHAAVEEGRGEGGRQCHVVHGTPSATSFTKLSSWPTAAGLMSGLLSGTRTALPYPVVVVVGVVVVVVVVVVGQAPPGACAQWRKLGWQRGGQDGRRSGGLGKGHELA